MIRVSVAFNQDRLYDVDVFNRGPQAGVYAEGDWPGGPGLRVYEWAMREPFIAGGKLLHRRSDGAATLVALVFAELAKVEPAHVFPEEPT